MKALKPVWELTNKAISLVEEYWIFALIVLVLFGFFVIYKTILGM